MIGSTRADRRRLISGLSVALALGLASAAASFDPAWGRGTGGGGKKPSTEKNDPEKMKRLRDLTKRLSSELHLDNQKSAAVQMKELQQADEMREIINASPNQDDPSVKDAKAALSEWANSPTNAKY